MSVCRVARYDAGSVLQAGSASEMSQKSQQIHDRDATGAGRSPKSIAKGLGLFAIILLGTQEVVSRVVFPQPEVSGFHRMTYAGRLADHLELPPKNLAHRTLWWWSAPDGAAITRQLNLYGFRDRDWRRRKPSRSRRVAFVGDSLVEGLGATDGSTMSDEFARRALAGKVRADVQNWGAGGFGLENYARLIADAVPLFEPDDLILVLYMNDLYRIPEGETDYTPSGLTASASKWRPRLLSVLDQLRAGKRVPRRWHEPAEPEPRPLAVKPRFKADPQLLRNIERFVEPDLAVEMKAGRMSPAITNLLARSERVLQRPVEVTPWVRELEDYLDSRGVRLWVVYLPSMNQVSDDYLDVQRRMSAPIPVETLTGPAYQEHARDVAAACAELGVRFLDLTPALRNEEEDGRRLYWPHDGHMNDEGYRLVGREIEAWWRAAGAKRQAAASRAQKGASGQGSSSPSAARNRA